MLTKIDNTIVSAGGASSSSSSSNKTNTTDDAKSNAETESELDACCYNSFHEETQAELVDCFYNALERLKDMPANQLVTVLKGIIFGIFRWVPPCHCSKVVDFIGLTIMGDTNVSMGQNPSDNAVTKEESDAVKTMFKFIEAICKDLTQAAESIVEDTEQDKDNKWEWDKKVKNKELIDQITTRMKCFLGEDLVDYAKTMESLLSRSTFETSDLLTLCSNYRLE